MEYRVIEREDTLAAGMVCTLKAGERENAQTVQALWQKFHARQHEIQSVAAEPQVQYGVMTFPAVFNPADSAFTYMACTEVADTNNLPAGMNSITIPGGNYCVITHKGPLSELSRVFDWYNNVLLPKGEVRPRGVIEFERYDDRFKGFDKEDTEVDVYFPIE